MDSLWPKIEVTVPKPPVAILKEQASLLGMQTQNLVVAEVRPTEQWSRVDTVAGDPNEQPLQWRDWSKGALAELTNQFRYSFDLVAPALNHYRYQLFVLSYGIDLYPVIFRLDSDIAAELSIAPGQPFQVNSEADLVEALRAIFNSSKTQRVIGAILIQSHALAN